MIGRTRVKICGLTRREDAELSVALGADAVGFVLWPGSPRHVEAARAREISRALPPFVTRVGVFVNMPPTDVAAVAGEIGLDVIQLHGEEELEVYRGTGRRLIRSVCLDDDRNVKDAEALPADVTPLIDARDASRRGGTGRMADWNRAAVLARSRAVMLAGGLTSDNVAEAVRRVRPWAVDVSSGVEDRPGIKNAQRLREFFEALTGAAAEDE